MIEIEVDLSEVQQWAGLLAEEIIEIGQRVEVAVGEQTDIVNQGATRDVPVLTGALRGTIRSTGKGLRRSVRAGTSRVFWARFQEFGTRKMSANPFLLPQADEAAQRDFVRRVDQAVNGGAIYQ